jgi:N-acetyl-S-(2-succino)cysteine monooxygenase
MTPFSPQPFERFVDRVVPILVSRGLFRKDYEGKTLRDHLGLQRPPHPATRAEVRSATSSLGPHAIPG